MLNLIKIRYLDAPVFMDVASVISQYEREFSIVHGYLAENDRDVLSKRTFYFLMLMFSFTERRDNVQAMPALTVPTN